MHFRVNPHYIVFVYELSGCVFESSCRTDTFNKSRLVMTFLTILRVTETLCSLRLVLEGKTGKEIPESLRLESLETFLTNNFALSDAKDSTSRSMNGVGTFAENTFSDSPKVLRVKFLGKGRFFYFICICKFGSFKNNFAIITSLSEL